LGDAILKEGFMNMGAFTLAIIVGSLRKDSSNLKLAKAVSKLGQGKFTAKMITIGDLPLFNEDLEKDFPAQALNRGSKKKQAATIDERFISIS